MREKLLKEAAIYGAAALLFLALTVLVSRLFVFLCVIFGIMFISCFGGAYLSAEKGEKKAKQAPLKPLKSPFALTEEDIKAQIDSITALYESGQMTKEMYEEERKQLEMYLSKAI